MEKLSVLNIKGEKISDIKLNDAVWAIEPNDAVLYDAITLYRNASRQGTSDTKTRSEVSGGGKKPWKQKGTGHARQGSIRAPHWTGGGIVFGPHPRDFGKKMNRKERKLALKSALAYKAVESKLVVIDKFDLATSKTKDVKELLNKLDATKKVLIVVNELSENAILATRNLKNVVLLEVSEINTYDIIAADKLLIESEAIKTIEEVLI